LGSELRAAQSRGEWPGLSVTCREGLASAAVRREGANAALGKAFEGGNRRDDAAEGGGRRGVGFEGRGGGGMEPEAERVTFGGGLVEESKSVGAESWQASTAATRGRVSFAFGCESLAHGSFCSTLTAGIGNGEDFLKRCSSCSPQANDLSPATACEC
jgi:hypothetical protein